MIENLDGIATIGGEVALILLQQSAKAAGYSRFFHKRITFAEYGDPENRSRRFIVAFHDSLQLQRQWTWPTAFAAEWSLNRDHRKCAVEALQPSTVVPARFWDHRSCHEVDASWRKNDKQKDSRIFTLGYKDKYSKIGT